MSRPILLSVSGEERVTPYVEALKLAGIDAERIEVVHPSPESVGDAPRRAAGAAGLVLCGGGDIDPRFFGEDPLAGATLEIIPLRDDLELALLAGARAAATPVWGVCRGLQVINVFFGGSLWQDLPSQLPGSVPHQLPEPRDALAHSVEIRAADTGLGSLLDRGSVLVNSRHHQAIRRLADDLVVAATAPDGLIEAVASSEPSWWVEAVQWHPENLVAMAPQRALWQRFLAAVAHREDRSTASCDGIAAAR